MHIAQHRGADQLKKEVVRRKKLFDGHGRTRASPIKVGTRVLVRERGIQGRNKIQDRWSSRVHKVLDDHGNDNYTIEPADSHGKRRVVNRSELQLCPPMVLRDQDIAIGTTQEQTTTKMMMMTCKTLILRSAQQRCSAKKQRR